MPATTLKLDIGHSLFLMHEHLYLGCFNYLTALTVHQPPFTRYVRKVMRLIRENSFN